jgi:hypothetical protein
MPAARLSFLGGTVACLLFAAGCRKTPARTSVRANQAASAASAGALASASADPSSPGTEATTPTATETAGPYRWLAIGGGPAPENTEVSLEQDIDLVRKTLPGKGAVLFAGGSNSLSVRELDPDAKGDALLVALGDLFHPRSGRRSHYRRPVILAERATLENVEERLDGALSSGTGPLLVYVAAHGDQGEHPRDNLVALWGNRTLTVAHLTEIAERHSRPLRLVMTSCFSGGFAEVSFEHADEGSGPSKVLRCGVFAGPWDRQTSGCDANPDRRAQESYGLHFVHALGKTDRSGAPLTAAQSDFDGDGVVGLLDAHTRARISAVSLDVPTTTSERFLRKSEHGSAAIDPRLLPEDAAVVSQLGAALALTSEAAVTARWNELDETLAGLEKTMDDHDDALAAADAALGARLLEQWPVIDDPYHPAFGPTLAQNRKAITDVLEASKEADARNRAQSADDETENRHAELEVQEARVLRLKRAYETLHKVAALAHRGGRDYDRYRALLSCERAAP